jgi:hypothetical protein
MFYLKKCPRYFLSVEVVCGRITTRNGNSVKKYPGGMTCLQNWLRIKMRLGECGLKIEEKKMNKDGIKFKKC